jgi:N-methylhydantoinase B/oxoprolinase/acetone carboxylase alpha subunit
MAITVPGDRTAAEGRTLRERLQASEQAFRETRRYAGIDELTHKNADPLAYDSFHARLLSMVISARETSKRISASPGVREVGESVVALYTPEGDSIVLSTGIVIHVHTMSRFIKWMIEHGYEEDPGIRPGDIFANNDPFVSDVHPPDLMTVIPLFHGEELIGWAGAVCHEIETGGVVGGANMGTTAERFGNGLTVTAEKIGQDDTINRDYWLRAEYNLRTPIYWILDQKAMVSACLEVRERVGQLVEEYGVDYYRTATHELIEEARAAHLERMRIMTVPGRYRVPAVSAHLLEGKPGTSPLSHDVLLNAPLEIDIAPDGHMRVSLDGIGPQTWTPFNCALSASDGVLFVALTQFMDYDGRVNDGAWYALDFDIPEGSFANPDSHLVSIGGIWSVIMPVFGAWMRAMSRAFLARGFKEEIHVGMVTTPIFEGGGINQYGQRSGVQNLECASEGSGARGIMDGIDNGYVGWNPESDMGNVEIWEQFLPILYLGRRVTRDTFGWGRYRGGTTMDSIYLFRNTPMWLVLSTIHSDLVFDNAGLCGGYPAPTARYFNTVVGSDVIEAGQARRALPHVEGDPADPDVARLLNGRHEVEKGFYHQPRTEGDVFQFFYNTGGGYGDPLERDVELVRSDLDEERLSVPMARAVHGVVAALDEESDRHVVDVDATHTEREAIRRRRLERAVPASEWWARERERVARRDLAPLVRDCYAGSFGMSESWRREFVEFWELDADFAF